MSIRFSSLVGMLAAAALLVATGFPAAAAEAERTWLLATHQDEDTPPVTAVGLRASGFPAEAPATRLYVLLDTSASQTGTIQRDSLAAIDGVLESVRTNDSVMLGSIDVTCMPFMESFARADDPLVAPARRELGRRTPLGNTDLLGGLRSALEQLAGGTAPGAIIYIGDGPGLTGILPEDFAATLAALRQQRVSFSAVAIGNQVNWPCLASLAAGSGGNVLVPGDSLSPREAGQRMAGQAVAPILWPDDGSLELASQMADTAVAMLPFQLPPLRHDRESVILFLGPLAPASITTTAERTPGQDSPDSWPEVQLTFDLPQRDPSSDHAFLEQLARNAFDTGGIFLPLLGREGLEIAKRVIREEAETLAKLSRQAEASGAHAAASRLAAASLRRDPDNPEAALVRTASQKSMTGSLPTPAQPVAQREPAEPTSAPPERLPGPSGRSLLAADQSQSELQEIENRRRIRSQLLERETAVGLRDARHLMATDPDAARINLKNLQQQVRASTDLDEAVRGRLERQIEISLRESLVRSQEKLERDLALERTRAVARERARISGELRRREEKFSQLAKRYHALVEEGIRVGYQQPTRRFTEAERDIGKEMLLEAPNLYANQGMPMTARAVARQAPLVAGMLDYHTKNTRFRREMQRGFMDTLQLVDVAAIPFPDEPPIIYPDPARWRRITEIRKKYKSVDLGGDSESETKIYEALEKTTEGFDLTDQGVTLAQFKTIIEDKFGIQVQIDPYLVNEFNIEPNEPPNLIGNYSGITLRSVLRRALATYGEVPLTYVIRDEVLLITEKTYAEQNYMSIKVYPVADLVIPVNPSGGLNPFQTGGGLGGAGGINSGQGGGIPAGGAGGGGMMGGGMFQIADADAAVSGSRRALRTAAATRDSGLSTPASSSAERTELEPSGGVPLEDLALAESLLEADDLAAEILSYLGPLPDGSGTDRSNDAQPTARQLAVRLARIRATAALLGRENRFADAADLLTATIASGHVEPWMYESLALALEGAGRPRAEVERALLSAADLATDPIDLLALASYLARLGSERQAVRVCQQVAILEPDCREAYALGLKLAADLEDPAALRWTCAGVLAHEWPASQRDVSTRAARLAKATIAGLKADGNEEEAAYFTRVIEAALVRDISMELTWNGDADIDLIVEEPPGTVCSVATPRSTSGGTLLADGTAETGTTQTGVKQERYVATAAFPGTYRVLVRRSSGEVTAGLITAELTLYKGTPFEETMKRQLPVEGDEMFFTVEVPAGRRRQPLVEAQMAQDVALQQEVSRAILAQQLSSMSDQEAVDSLSLTRPPKPSTPIGRKPFTGANATGFQPIITTLPEGTNLQAMAVVSADRRYVRITSTPLFSGVGQVTTFNFASGGAQGTGGAGGGGMGGGGMGGGGMGGGGMGGGGMGGMGGGGMGMCWVAREVYGIDNPKWLMFRSWLLQDAPGWLVSLYANYGEDFAAWVRDKPTIKAGLGWLMDRAID